MTTETVPTDKIKEGDPVLLWFEEKDVRYMVQAVPGRSTSIHCGQPITGEQILEHSFGDIIECQHGKAYLVKPSLEDFMMKANRASGIVYPKDAAFLIMRLGLKAGDKVMEIGTGSGSLTMALAQTVSPGGGMVHTYDRREDLPKNAIKNLERTGLIESVKFHQRQSSEPFEEKDFDAVILDIPTPWEEVEVLKPSLKGSARLVSLNPTFNQIEKMAETLRKNNFIQVEAVELLERPILAREGKTRPVMRMVSHTEFMLFGICMKG